MPLSRLENFLINTDGNILYVNPSDLDATDSFDNKGNSLTRPFVTIQRALLEAARFSYQTGANNDRYDKTTILLYPGTHYVDNRPGLSIKQDASVADYYDVNGNEVTANIELTNSTIFDLDNSSNVLYKFNSVDGGVIVPKGTSIVGLDLRKTKVKPLYVPDPTKTDETAADYVPSTSIFKVTGGCYFWQFSIFDADKSVYYNKDFTLKASPNRSHHKLTVFEYADGVNAKDLTGLTDLAQYYFKLMNAYGQTTGNRQITDYPGSEDFEPNSPEFKIVGDLREDNLKIIRVTAVNNEISVDTQLAHSLSVDDTVRITGISSALYNRAAAVTGITSERKFTYLLPSVPSDTNIAPSSGQVVVEPDNVTGASPYIFNCSLRSTYGMCGLHADGSKATGFKSMVVAQFTGIGLQKDDNAFLIYNEDSGQFEGPNDAATAKLPLYINQNAVYNPKYGNYHVKASNDAFIQAVSVFAIGFYNQFLSEGGSDQSITNSNSNFGAKSLISKGFKKTAFRRDDNGYITHIVPPKDLQEKPFNVLWKTINVGLTTNPTVGSATTSILYLEGDTDKNNPPSNISGGYRIGSKENEQLYLGVNLGGTNYTYSTPLLMQIPGNTDGPAAKKEFFVDTIDPSSGNDSLTLTENHTFIAGEKVRLLSDNGIIPDGLESEGLYYIITTGNAKVVKLAKSLNDAVASTPVPIDIKNANGGGIISLISRVTDKLPGEAGHPIQYDADNSNWYAIGAASTDTGANPNTLFQALVDNPVEIAANNASLYVSRTSETRGLTDRIYKLRYVIPKDSNTTAKAPEKNYVLQESSTTGITPNEEITITSINSNRNPRVITGITTANLEATVTTEAPHKLSVDDRIFIKNVTSTENTTGAGNTGFNGYHYVKSITGTKTFTYNIPKKAGTFTNVTYDTSTVGVRTEGLPVLSRNEYDTAYTIQDVETIQEYIPQQSDGVYYLTCLIGNISPTVSEFSSDKFKQNVQDLYPVVDIDNPNNDPNPTKSIASNSLIGKVTIDNSLNSITREGIIDWVKDNRVGFAVTGAISANTGISDVYSEFNHNLNSINGLTIDAAGAGYGAARRHYNATLVGSGLTGQDATAIVNVNGSGAVAGVTIVDGGSAYGIGNTMVVTIPGITQSTNAIVSVSSIDSAVGKTIELLGVGTDRSRNGGRYNGVYPIIDIPSPKTVRYNTNYINAGIYTGSEGIFHVTDTQKSVTSITADGAIQTFSHNGINDAARGDGTWLDISVTGGSGSGATFTIQQASGIILMSNISSGIGYKPGDVLTLPASEMSGAGEDILITVNTVSGLAIEGSTTVSTGEVPHGLAIGNKIRIDNVSGTAAAIYNKDFIVQGVGSTTNFTVSAPGAATTTGISTAAIYKYGIVALGQDSSLESEKIAGSLFPLYGGYSTEITAASGITTVLTNNVKFGSTVGFDTGSFVQIDNELIRITKVESATEVDVLRGVLGTKATSHDSGSVVRKVNVIPSETRRFSSIRASGHTFEYVGYGPGNYSTALPQRQSKTITSEEELLSISVEQNGGIVFFSGMNDRGEYFSGERAQPRETFLGGEGSLTATFDDVYIRNTLRVGGGPNRNLPSEFRGPVNFTNKITSTAKEGIDAIKLLIKGVPDQNPSLQVGGDNDPTFIVKQSTQNVGIRTANPAYELDVNGTIRATTYENFKLTDLPNSINEEVTFAPNRILKVKNDGSSYELIDAHELDAFKLISLGVSNDGTIYSGIGNTVTVDAASKLQITGIATSRFYKGEYVKLFGVDKVGAGTTVEDVTGQVATKVGTVDEPNKYNYWVAQYNLNTGRVGMATEVAYTGATASAGFAHTSVDNFNDLNYISISATRSNASHGVLVYRQTQILTGVATDIGQSKLIAVLGGKEFGDSNSMSWKDYGTYDQTAWSAKGTENEYQGIGVTAEGQIHFPLIGTTGYTRGWALDKIISIGTSSITVNNEYGLNDNVGFGITNGVRVVHDNTYSLSQAIDKSINSGGNYLDLPSGTYLANKIVLPSGFTLKGLGKNTVVKQQYYATDLTDGAGNSLTQDGNFVGVGTDVGATKVSQATDVTLSDITFDGNSSNNVNFKDEATSFSSNNYLVYMNDVKGAHIRGIEVRNSPGGGLIIRDSERVSVENSTFVDGCQSDRDGYQPLDAQNAKTLRVNDSLFENYPGALDVSTTSVVSTGGNIIRNCGTGLRFYATGKITTTNNLILGPADEWIPSPDIYDSDWNSVNISVEPGTKFTSPVYLYVEDGDYKNLAGIAITGGIGTMTYVAGAGSTEVLSSYLEPDIHMEFFTQDKGDFGRESGYIQFQIVGSGTNLIGLTSAYGYKIQGTEYADKPVGYTTYVGIGTGDWVTTGVGTDKYYVALDDKTQSAGISTGDIIKLVSHDVTPDVSSVEFTVEQKTTTAGITSLRLKGDTFATTTGGVGIGTTIGQVDGTRSGYISIRRTFIIAKGRVGVT